MSPMNKFAILVTLAALLSGTGLAAQQTTGVGAADSSQAGGANHWQNWAFAGSAICIAALGVFAVAVGNGQSGAGH